uniref:Perlucin-like protein n=1 Tax=Crassostrea virginica TaxID=6565 RepID=A0A8B8C5Q7_CRAVI|nr:perlucin-like protein [Crassostrea virginica]
MWICSIAVVRPNIVSRHYVRNDSFTDKILNINPARRYPVASLRVCSTLCNVHGSCFGYHVTTSACCVYESCQEKDITGDETGWVYYEEVINCDSEWMEYNGHCYFRNTTLMTQPEAMNTCNLYGGYLVEINDEEENAWITQTLLKDVYCTNKYECTTWCGANDVDNEGVFIWEHSGSPVTYKKWDGANPDNPSAPSKPIDCVDLFYNGEWNDRPCAFLAAFVCEK